MKTVIDARHQIIYRDEFSYCAHPHIAALADGSWLAVFNRTVRRPFILHPPEDPHYYNVTVRSQDQGETWSAPQVAPGYDWYGVECAGLTSLRDGAVLLNQWRFRWYPIEAARRLPPTPGLTFPEDWLGLMQLSGETNIDVDIPEDILERVPWARANGGTYVHRSTDLGKTWEGTTEIDTHPYSGGYGMRGAVELASGELLLPLSDVPHYRTVFVARSRDQGRSWGELVEAASAPDCWFEEPSAVLLPNGRILMLLRENRSHYLYSCESEDGGWTWSAPERTPVWGYPAQLLVLPDERLLCIYGYRDKPYGIRAVVSRDQGKSWDVDNTLVIRADLPNRDLGYPGAVLTGDGNVYTVYYGQDPSGITCIHGTHFRLP